MICQTDRTGRVNVNNSATELFHNHLPAKAIITIAITNANNDATISLYDSLEPDMSVIHSIPALQNPCSIFFLISIQVFRKQ